MTDKEIKKALECCEIAYDQDCTECPLYPDDGEIACREVLREEALDLITRQQAEIEQWKEEANKYQNLWCMAVDDIEKAKSEAVKEFAEKLKNEINIRTTYSREQDKNVMRMIDNLVKEMVGEEE